MDADLAPGFAWMVMATDDGGTDRMHEGKSDAGFGSDFCNPAEFAFPLPFLLAGAIVSTFKLCSMISCFLLVL
ncbi:hypothetical protein LINGRAHAP2_LOCUS11915 [Linum grandiflorum]